MTVIFHGSTIYESGYMYFLDLKASRIYVIFCYERIYSNMNENGKLNNETLIVTYEIHLNTIVYILQLMEFTFLNSSDHA